MSDNSDFLDVLLRGTAGIGHAVSKRLAELGADLVVSDTGDTDFEPLLTTIEKCGRRAISIPLDLRDSSKIDVGVTRALGKLGHIDILVNNAGVTGGASRFLELTDTLWDLNYEVNLRGPAMLCKAVLPQMLEQGYGVIVNVASLAALGALDTVPANYTASKFGLVGLTKVIANEPRTSLALPCRLLAECRPECSRTFVALSSRWSNGPGPRLASNLPHMKSSTKPQ